MRSDPVWRHVRTGKLYRILVRYNQVGRELAHPRALCQLVVTLTPRAYASDTRMFMLKSLEALTPDQGWYCASCGERFASLGKTYPGSKPGEILHDADEDGTAACGPLLEWQNRLDEPAKNHNAVELGRLGGLAGKGKTSPAKAVAARENGKLGGRPKLKPDGKACLR